jgi:hypothetical protein
MRNDMGSIILVVFIYFYSINSCIPLFSGYVILPEFIDIYKELYSQAFICTLYKDFLRCTRKGKDSFYEKNCFSPSTGGQILSMYKNLIDPALNRENCILYGK